MKGYLTQRGRFEHLLKLHRDDIPLGENQAGIGFYLALIEEARKRPADDIWLNTLTSVAMAAGSLIGFQCLETGDDV